MNTSKIIKTIIGLALISIGVYLFISENYSNTDYNSTFANEPILVQGLNAQNVDAVLPKKVIIPSLRIDIEIKNSRVINGYWEVHDDYAGWGEGSGVPGVVGNQVIFAHATDTLFGPLKDIKNGAKIYILTKASQDSEEGADSYNESWYEYKVTDIKSVYPSQVNVIAPTEDETLTLYTCSGYRDSKRLIVVAKRT